MVYLELVGNRGVEMAVIIVKMALLSVRSDHFNIEPDSLKH